MFPGDIKFHIYSDNVVDIGAHYCLYLSIPVSS